VANVFIRGASADQVLVLVDGARVNSATLGAFDFANLTTENIERIEVLRGFGGTLYGSEAVGGVIQIFTRKGTGPFHGSVATGGGNGSTDREVAEISGQAGIFSYSGSASHFRTDGFKPENDDYENTVVSGRLDADVIENGSARLVYRIGSADFGNFFSNNFLAAPDPNARQEDDSAVARGDWNHTVLPGVQYRIGFSYTRDDLAFRDPPDAAETSSTDSDFLSQIFTGDLQSNLSWWSGRGESTFGVEYEVQSGDVDSQFSDPAFGAFPSRFDRDIRNVAGYMLQHLFLDERRFGLVGGVRVDDNQRFGQAVSPSGGVTYALSSTGTRFRATYAEGFKAPTLNELFFPDFGNPNLDAESSWEASGGFDQPGWSGRVLLSASYFHRQVTNLIEGVPQENGLFRAENVGKATVDGVETALEFEVLPYVRVGGNYTFLDIDAETSGKARKAKHSGSVHVAAGRDGIWKRGDRFSADIRLLLVGAREDFDPAAFFAARENPAYQRADLAVSYGWPVVWWQVARAGVFARAENLFDRDYQEVLGFGARPFNILAGVKAEF
jgi:vitamin B12 transporter